MDFSKEKMKEYNFNNEYIEKNLSNNFSIILSFGKHKLNKGTDIAVENINIDLKNIKNYEIKQIIKEIFLLNKLKNTIYFPKLITFFKSNDNEDIYFIFEGNKINLKMLINSKIFDYKKQEELIKFIIYQIAYGLYFLHSNKIIHHNIKPVNILINETAEISIYNFLSTIYKGEQSIYYTPSYAAPEIFIKESIIDEKYDMWALGVIIIELYLKQLNFFGLKNGEKKGRNFNQINEILSRFQIDENKIKDPKILLENILNGKIKAEFKIEQISKGINDSEAIELIKNLIIINPKKRYSAEQVLRSDFLKTFWGLDSLEIQPNNLLLNYNENYEYLKDKTDKTTFIKFIDNVVNSFKS